ncbi:MAG: SMP-30/gluconolactonase/LRE family protein [Pseudomonadota bacterium]
MKRCFACACVWLLSIGCNSSSDPNSGPINQGGAAGSAGSPVSQAGGGSANVAGGGAAAGGASGGSGGLVGAAGSTGSAGSPGGAGGAGTAGNPGSAGGAGAAGMASVAFTCPAGPFPAFTAPSGMASKIAGAPPADAFNKDNFTNVEGPVWIGDSLYFSEMTGNNMIPPARILKIAPGGVVSVVSTDSGSNGLAVDGSGNLIAAVHKDGSISQIALPGGAATPLISKYGDTRFNSPNDLAIRSDGTIYFSDPMFQNNANPQKGEHLYRATPPPARTVSIITDAPSTPNGVTLSPDEKTLYVSGSGLKKFAVMSDGSLGAGADFVVGSGGDGMVVDCAGNLFVAGNMGNVVRVYSAAGALLGTIQAANAGTTTNVAFGGTDHKTLYITAQGNEGQRGVFSIALSVPGFPY